MHRLQEVHRLQALHTTNKPTDHSPSCRLHLEGLTEEDGHRALPYAFQAFGISSSLVGGAGLIGAGAFYASGLDLKPTAQVAGPSDAYAMVKGREFGSAMGDRLRETAARYLPSISPQPSVTDAAPGEASAAAVGAPHVESANNGAALKPPSMSGYQAIREQVRLLALHALLCPIRPVSTILALISPSSPGVGRLPYIRDRATALILALGLQVVDAIATIRARHFTPAADVPERSSDGADDSSAGAPVGASTSAAAGPAAADAGLQDGNQEAGSRGEGSSSAPRSRRWWWSSKPKDEANGQDGTSVEERARS